VVEDTFWRCKKGRFWTFLNNVDTSRALMVASENSKNRYLLETLFYRLKKDDVKIFQFNN